jgi:hypothetical protein
MERNRKKCKRLTWASKSTRFGSSVREERENARAAHLWLAA